MATLTRITQVAPPDAARKKPSQAVRPQDESLINKLKTEILDLWAVKTLENWFWLGKKLWQLKVERSKPGSGKFMADLDELGIPYWTAYRRINFYGTRLLRVGGQEFRRCEMQWWGRTKKDGGGSPSAHRAGQQKAVTRPATASIPRQSNILPLWPLGF